MKKRPRYNRLYVEIGFYYICGEEKFTTSEDLEDRVCSFLPHYYIQPKFRIKDLKVGRLLPVFNTKVKILHVEKIIKSKYRRFIHVYVRVLN